MEKNLAFIFHVLFDDGEGRYQILAFALTILSGTTIQFLFTFDYYELVVQKLNNAETAMLIDQFNL